MRPSNTEPRGPECLQDILARVFTLHKIGRRSERLALEATWAEIAGPYAESTRVNALQRGVLEIVVANSILLQELTQFHKKQLLRQLQEKVAGPVKDLRFRVGPIA